MGALKDIANDFNLYLIEDACQSHGTKYLGKKVGSLGDINTFSFYPSKNMTTGEGGMITTNNDELAEQCRLLRHHGEPEWYVYNRLGYNYRMTEIQAAIGRVQLKKIDSKVLYPKPLYETKLFKEKIAYPKGCPWSCPYYGKEIDYNKIELPIVDKVTKEIFALDIHPKTTKEGLDQSINSMQNIIKK